MNVMNSASRRIDHYSPALVAWVAGLLTLLVYLRALTCDFVNWDDPAYVVMNPAIRILDRTFVAEAFVTSYMGWWMPLTWISIALDYRLWELNPLGYHLTNIILHTLNTVLVVLIADRILARLKGAGYQAASGTTYPDLSARNYLYPAALLLSGLLWGIHPLRVESVAWVSERKDVLNGLFSLSSVLCYLRYVQLKEQSPPGTAAIGAYLLALLLFLMSLMAKPVSVVIPAMLLVLDWFPLGRLDKKRFLKVLIEKIPFIFLSAAVAVITVYLASSQTILISFQYLPMYRRLILAAHSVMEYCRMSVYPVGLTNLYLLPQVFPALYYVNAIVSVFVTWYCIACYKTKPWILSSWLLFLLPLLPVLGIFQNGDQSHADRFTYLPAVFPSIAAAVITVVMYRNVSSNRLFLRRTVVAGILGVLVFYAGMTQHLIAAWQDSGTLWTRLIELRPVGRAYYYRGDHYLQTGRYREAADDLHVSIQMARNAGNMQVFNLYALRGHALYKAGSYEESVKSLTEAIARQQRPNYYYHRGLALRALGRKEDAETDFRRAGTETGPLEWKF